MGAANGTERGATTSLVVGRCGAAHLKEKGKKLWRRAGDADGPAREGALDPSSSCRRYLSTGSGNQCDGVILIGAPFSPTHSPASGDQ